MKVLVLELFALCSFIVVAFALFLTHKLIKNPERRKIAFAVSAFLCLFIHYLEWLVNLLKGTPIPLSTNLYLPEWPCNVFMWVNLILAVLIFFKKNKVSEALFDITFWVGTICGVVGICANFNYFSTPDFSDLGILKGLLSHVPLIYCCAFAYTEKYTKYDTLRVIVATIHAFILFFICGNFSALILGIQEGSGYCVNGTMLNSPFDKLPWLNIYTIGPMVIAIYLVSATLYETINLPKEKRWYNIFKQKFSLKEKTEE